MTDHALSARLAELQEYVSTLEGIEDYAAVERARRTQLLADLDELALYLGGTECHHAEAQVRKLIARHRRVSDV